MKTKLCEMFGIDVPIVAFSHCRDVVVAAAKAGGIGVFGADTSTPEQLAIELQWIEDHIGGRPYGVDVLFPMKYDDVARHRNTDPLALIPQQHRDFVEDLLDRHGVPHLPGDEEQKLLSEMLNRRKGTPQYTEELLEVIFRFRGVKLLVTAIGTPPPGLVEKAHAAGMKFGAMVGKPQHAIRQRDAGVDLIIAQGHEAGGHTGEITTMVLIPQIVDAVAPLPVLAAGGIGRGRQVAAALALGAEGVWCGSVWLTTQESDSIPALRKRLLAATSSDTVRTRSFTGKHGRFLKSAWSDAWESPEAPEPLGRPLQYFLRTPSFARIDRVGAEALVSSPIGQIVGEMKTETTVRQVFTDMLSEYADALERMNRLSE
jgi:NAD(P)H-dependent flavin oxidoreductase YrpB (nitropropane dioxygenase family)